MKPFEQKIRVTKAHLDELQHVNNVQYLQWVQDIAGAHWQFLIAGKTETFGLWMVRSHNIKYKHQAKLGDNLRAVTHVEATKDFLSERIVSFYLENTTTLLVQCSTQWCYLHPTTQKLLRIPVEINMLFT